MAALRAGLDAIEPFLVFFETEEAEKLRSRERRRKERAREQVRARREERRSVST